MQRHCSKPTEKGLKTWLVIHQLSLILKFKAIVMSDYILIALAGVVVDIS